MPSPVLSPRQFEWVLAAFGATLAAHMLWLPVWLSALLGIAVLARWLQRRHFGMGWPGWVKFPLLLLTIVVIIVEFGDPTSRQAGTAALTGFCTLKLIETERRRDGLLMLTVCLFLVSIQFLFNQGMLITAYMVVPCLLTFLALNEVSAPPGTQGGLASRLGAVTRELLPLLGITLPLTVFLFFSVPRLSSPLWGSPTVADGGRTSLGGEMAPGSITELLADDTPAFRATFDGPVPPNSALYWRGPVLWRFDGGVRWLATRSRQMQLGRGLVGPTSGAPGDVRYHVMLEPTDRPWLFLLDLPTGLPVNSRRLSDGQVVRDQPVTSAYAYDAASDLDAATPVGLEKDDEFSGIQRDPRLNPRTTELARQWVAEIGPDRERLVQRALQYFNEEEFRYSLSPPPLTSVDRIDEFLFDTREGFCEHYSSSFTMLMRAAGVPARVVTGYLGGDFNRIGGYLVVRNSDAHAWSEVLIEGRGWVRVDPTGAVAPERVELGSAGAAGDSWGQSEWLKGLRDRLDAVQSWWTSNMVQFNAGSQRSFFDKLGIDPSDWRHAAAWMAGGLGAIGLLTVALFYRSRLSRTSAPGARAYAKFLKRLAKAGVVRGGSEGPIDFGARAARQLPHWADDITTVSRAYGISRYGPLDAAMVGQLEAAVAGFLERSRG